MKKGTLYLVPNTLGEDSREAQIAHVIPPEVAHRAAQLDFWIVENAKTARAFLSAIQRTHPLHKPLQEISMTLWRGPRSDSNPKTIIAPLLEGHDMGLISEAGLPAIADPGAEIVALAHQLHIPVRPLTGPSSLMLGLMASGMNGQQFTFHGYLPIKEPERQKKICAIEQESRTHHSAHLWIETPYRNSAMLASLMGALHPQTQLCLAIDLTLNSEQIVRLAVESWQKLLQKPTTQFPENLDKRPAVFILQA